MINSEIVRAFIEEYYKNNELVLRNKLYMFSTNCMITFNNIELVGSDSLLLLLSQNNIYKLVYQNLVYRYQILHDGILIIVSGLVMPIYYNNIYSSYIPFTDVFKLSKLSMFNDSLFITNYFFI